MLWLNLQKTEYHTKTFFLANHICITLVSCRRPDEAENMPITLDLENVRHKRENNILQQIRTNPPSPQCFSAGLTKPNPSKGSRSRLMVCSNSSIKLFLLIDDALLANIRLDKIKLYHHLIDCGMYISHRLPYRVGYYQCRKLEECF